MHIGMVLIKSRPYPPDVRVDKEIGSLCEAGHEVFVFARTMGTERPGREALIPEKAWVDRYDLPKLGAIPRFRSDVTFRYPEWEGYLARFITENRIDVLHVHNLLHIPLALRVAEEFGLPLVADLHENQPAAFRVYRRDMPFLRRMGNALAKNDTLYRWMEARVLRRCKKILVVVPEAAERLERIGIPCSDIVVVGNTEDETTFPLSRTEDRQHPAIRDGASSWTVSYIGNLGPHRGIDTMLKAIPLLSDRIPGFRFLVVGARGKGREQVLDQASRLGIRKEVEVLEWVPFEQVCGYILSSRVGIIPHNDFEHTQTTVPHKLFQIMLCQRPVLVSSCRPLRRIVEETGAGIVFRADDPRDLADKLLWMHAHQSALKEMGIRGRKAALGPYAWKRDASRLTRVYQALDRGEGEGCPPKKRLRRRAASAMEKTT